MTALPVVLGALVLFALALLTAKELANDARIGRLEAAMRDHDERARARAERIHAALARLASKGP